VRVELVKAPASLQWSNCGPTYAVFRDGRHIGCVATSRAFPGAWRYSDVGAGYVKPSRDAAIAAVVEIDDQRAAAAVANAERLKASIDRLARP